MRMIGRIGGVFLVLSSAALFCSASAHAWPGCTALFSAEYPDSSTEDEGACQTCHLSSAGGGSFNGYGQDLLDNGATGVGAACSNANIAGAFTAVELFDSDGEGTSNIDEINAHAQPGWCAESQGSSCTNAAAPPANILLDPDVTNNAAPIADTGGPYSGEAGTTLIRFDGSASSDPDGDALTFAWNFGDGSTAIEAMPTHTYVTAGDFQVTLVVNDGRMDSDSAVTAASITPPPSNLAPTANAGGPYDSEPGLAITLDGSLSSDPNDDPLTYAWDFGDGAMATGVAPTHAYVADGTYAISLIVNDGEFDSLAARTNATITTAVDQGDGAALYDTNCLACHGDPWSGPPVDELLPGLRRVTGARSCNISGSIFGTSVFPNGVPEMQFLQGMVEAEIDALAEYLNSRRASGELRYVTTCAGCHGNDGTGGRVGENVHGDSANETLEAITEEREMQYLACMPASDIAVITDFLIGMDVDRDDDRTDHDDDDKGGGTMSLQILTLLVLVGLARRRRELFKEKR